MAVKKVFTDENDCELEAFSSNDFCYIQITYTSVAHDYNVQFVTLNSDDLTELISELISIKKLIVANA